MNYFILFFIHQIFIIYTLIPNWDFESLSINLLSSSNNYKITIYNRKFDSINATLYKQITRSSGKVTSKNYLEVDTVSKEVPFEDINGHYKNKLGSNILICPKGKFHPYDFNNNKNITHTDFKENNNWDLRCFNHDTGYFLVFYPLNKEYNLFFYESNEYKKSTILNDYIYIYQLENGNKANNEKYKFLTLENKNDYLYLFGRYLIMNSGEKNINSPNYKEQKICELRNNTQAYFSNTKYFYYFSFNNIYDFISGFSTITIQYNDFEDKIPNVDVTKNKRSPLRFLDNVEIKEMNFIVGTQYIYYKIYNLDTEKYNYGLIDIQQNLVLYNFERSTEFIKYIPISNSGEILAIDSTSAYKICIIKSNNTCISPCSNLLLDPDTNKCSDKCDTGKIRLMPEFICIKEELCDTNIYLIQEVNGEQICGLCSYFNPDDNIYRFYGEEGCLSTLPNYSEYYNKYLDLLKCLTDYHYTNNLCKPDYCFERCEECYEISNNINDQKCLSCKDGYILDNNGNCEIPPTTIPTFISTTIMENFAIKNCSNERCYECTIESNKVNLCLSCDNNIYEKVNYTIYHSNYIDCKKKETLEYKYYYDISIDQYKPCYEKCKKCIGPGNSTHHNCLICEENYMFRPGDNPYNNCVVYSQYYYLSPYNEYKPLNNPQCPEIAKYTIKNKETNKTSCIHDCKADKEYKYLYNGYCYKSCSEIEETKNVNFICQETNLSKIYIKTNPIYLEYNDPLEVIQTLAISYAEEFNYTNKHISLYTSKDITVTFYKNKNIIGDTDLTMPKIDFGECYDKIKIYYNISESKDLIISIIEQKVKHNPFTYYSFFHPDTGKKLETEEICKNDTIQIKENLLSLLDKSNKNYEMQAFLLSQGINIYDIFDPYFRDICYEFDNQYDRDISLHDRIHEIYVNATLCDEGCINTGINLQNNEATCNCKYNDFTNNDLIHENVFLEYLFGNFLSLMSSTNLQVLKCYKYTIKYIKNSYGIIIVASLFLLSIIFSIFFCKIELINITRYIFSITEKYCIYLSYFPDLNNLFPPKRKDNKSKTAKLIRYPIFENISNKRLSKRNTTKNLCKNSNNYNISNSKLYQTNSRELIIYNKKRTSIIKFNSNEENKEVNIRENLKNFFDDYLLTPLDDLEYDDAIKKDKRKFCEYFFGLLKEKQNFAYTFIKSDPINTRLLKLILFCLNINLYFIVNALFFSESYIGEYYHIKKEEDNFYLFISRNLKNIIYSTFVGIAIGYIIDIFFVDEKKIKSLFKREKTNKLILKRLVALLIKEIQKRDTSFIVIVFIFYIFSLYYILCFNYVYPKAQMEWIKSSFLIILIMQLLSILQCLYITICRFLSFKYRSEKLYKVSKYFDN